jgi:hypothetical protein
MSESDRPIGIRDAVTDRIFDFLKQRAAGNPKI